jgi:hypothetical protein
MLPYSEVLRRSLKIAAILVAMDVMIAFVALQLGLPCSGVLGDLLLLEVAALVLLGGLMDFGSSLGISQLRKVFSPSRGSLSFQERSEIERKAMVFLFAGLMLLGLMILLAVSNLLTQNMLLIQIGNIR